ncbi:MAG: hypothetical protein ACREBE_00635 [bacterium]
MAIVRDGGHVKPRGMLLPLARTTPRFDARCVEERERPAAVDFSRDGDALATVVTPATRPAIKPRVIHRRSMSGLSLTGTLARWIWKSSKR